MKNQIFISYRRNGGEALAQLLYDRLKNLGYEVFYDIESLKSGPFNTKLYRQIEECDDFLLILPPQALDRCIYEEDWLRCEIKHALIHDKNIIPIMMRGFVFPSKLPDDICEVSMRNAVEFETMEYLNAKIEKITSMLCSQPKDQFRRHEETYAPSMIRNVCSLGSCDFDNAFPGDAYYSEVINRSNYNIIYFHATIAPITDKKKINSHIVIFDSKNNIVYDDISEFDWKPEYDTLALSWVIKGRDGSFVKADTYRAEFSVENSLVYEYYFRVTSDNESLTNKESAVDNEIALKNKKSAKGWPTSIEKERSLPIGLCLHFASLVFWYSALLSSENIIVGLALAAVDVALFVLLIKYTKKYICPNLVISILLCTLFHFAYGIYLLIFCIVSSFRSLRTKK